MNKKLTRGLAAVVAACGIGAASVVAAAPAQADAPADLALLGGVDCSFGKPGVPWKDAWSMHRWMVVKNIGGTTMPGVTLQEINGPALNVGDLKPGQTSKPIETTWFGCFPSSIAGYTWGANAEPIMNNYGFWWNLRKVDQPAAPAQN